MNEQLIQAIEYIIERLHYFADVALAQDRADGLDVGWDALEAAFPAECREAQARFHAKGRQKELDKLRGDIIAKMEGLDWEYIPETDRFIPFGRAVTGSPAVVSMSLLLYVFATPPGEREGKYPDRWLTNLVTSIFPDPRVAK